MREELITAKINLLQRYMLILQRCYDPNIKSYAQYGDKGITVCDEWLNDFETFYKWAIANGYEKSLHLDKDQLCEEQGITPKVYSPTTCQFISPSDNAKLVTRDKKAVCKYDLKGNFLQEFTSAQAAATSMHVKNGAANINRCCNNLRGTTQGFQWRFKDNNFKDNIGTPEKRRTTAKPVLMLDTTTNAVIKEFPSIKAVNEYFGVNVNATAVINGERTQAKGYKWAFK